MTVGTIVIGADHAGYRTKEAVKKELLRKGHKVVDVGGFAPSVSDDYPTYALKVARVVARDKKSKGILICGTGTGMVMAANRVKGARAAVVYDGYSAVMSRRDNDANIIALRGRNFPAKKAARLVLLWLKTPFSGIPRHKRRIKKIDR